MHGCGIRTKNSAISRRHEPKVLFMFYEDINRDSSAAIRKVTMTHGEADKLANYLNIENFRKNSAVNNQVRRQSNYMWVKCRTIYT